MITIMSPAMKARIDKTHKKPCELCGSTTWLKDDLRGGLSCGKCGKHKPDPFQGHKKNPDNIRTEPHCYQCEDQGWYFDADDRKVFRQACGCSTGQEWWKEEKERHEGGDFYDETRQNVFPWNQGKA